MKQFGGHLSQDSLDALTELCGATIQTVMSYACDVDAGGAVLTADSISIQIGRERFVVIENDWADTPLEGLNYYLLSARLSPAPDRIFYDPNRRPGGFNYKNDHMSLHLGAEALVAKVEVLSCVEVGAEESVNYDAGVVVTREDGLRLGLIRKNSIAGSLHIAHTSADLVELLEGLEVRMTIAKGKR